MRTAKERTIVKTHVYHIYYSRGLYFIDYYHGGIIHSYSTLAAVKEALYYAGHIDSKTANV